MAAIMNMEQMQPDAQMQNMQLVPMMMVPCFVAAPEFCGGMWVPPCGGGDAPWSQGGYEGQFPQQQQVRRNSGKANRGSPAAGPWSPQGYAPCYGNSPYWPQQLETPVVVELSCLPKMLCSKMCLEAAIEQAGLDKDLQTLEIETGKGGQATLTLKSERAAQRCIRHFHGLQWAKSSSPISARIPGQPEQQAAAQPAAVKAPKAKKPAELVKEPSTPKKRISSFSSTSLSPKSTCCSSPALSAVSPSMKPRWADLDDDDSDCDDELSTKSTKSAGTFDLEGQSASDNGESSNTEE